MTNHLLLAGLLFLSLPGCGERDAPPSRNDAKDPLAKQDVLRFLKAHPVLLPLAAEVHDSARSSGFSGHEMVQANERLDAAAQEFGYSSFMAYEIEATRITNAASFLELAGGSQGGLAPPGSVREGDLDAVRPFLDDIRRVSRTASERIDAAPGGPAGETGG